MIVGIIVLGLLHYLFKLIFSFVLHPYGPVIWKRNTQAIKDNIGATLKCVDSSTKEDIESQGIKATTVKKEENLKFNETSPMLE